MVQRRGSRRGVWHEDNTHHEAEDIQVTHGNIDEPEVIRRICTAHLRERRSWRKTRAEARLKASMARVDEEEVSLGEKKPSSERPCWSRRALLQGVRVIRSLFGRGFALVSNFLSNPQKYENIV